MTSVGRRDGRRLRDAAIALNRRDSGYRSRRAVAFIAIVVLHVLAIRVLANNPFDIPFAAVYEFDTRSQHAVRIASYGPRGSAAAANPEPFRAAGHGREGSDGVARGPVRVDDDAAPDYQTTWAGALPTGIISCQGDWKDDDQDLHLRDRCRGQCRGGHDLGLSAT